MNTTIPKSTARHFAQTAIRKYVIQPDGFIRESISITFAQRVGVCPLTKNGMSFITRLSLVHRKARFYITVNLGVMENLILRASMPIIG